jgi:hypothetical protein
VGIRIIDIVIYAAVILAFVFISVFIVSGLTQGWKRAFPSAFTARWVDLCGDIVFINSFDNWYFKRLYFSLKRAADKATCSSTCLSAI